MSRENASHVDLLVNGSARRVSSRTLAELLDELELDTTGRGIAVARDGAVVPRGSWSATRLETGDRIEIVGAVQGG